MNNIKSQPMDYGKLEIVLAINVLIKYDFRYLLPYIG